MTDVAEDCLSSLRARELLLCSQPISEIIDGHNNRLIDRYNFIADFQYYTVSTLTEYEIQAFNVSLNLPSRLKEPGEIASWLLETDKLNRLAVIKFLSMDNQLCSETLEELAVKICSLEMVNTFAKGLKVFLPATGILDLDNDITNSDNGYNKFLHYDDDNDDSGDKKKELEALYNRIFHVYSRSHQTYCANKLLPHIANVDIIARVGRLMLELDRNLNAALKPASFIMTQFVDAMRQLMASNKLRPLTMREITDIYDDASLGRPLIPLAIPENVPSYLFSSKSKLCGWVSIGFAIDDPARQRLWVTLENNALYFFTNCMYDYQDVSPIYCLPLGNVQVLVGDGHDNLLIELWPIDGTMAPLLAVGLTEAQCSDVHISIPTVTGVTYHICIVMDVCPDSKNTVIQTLLDNWVDYLETTCWNCRRNALDNNNEVENI